MKEDREEIAPPQEYMRFDSPEAVANVEREDAAAYYEYDQSEGVYVVRTKDGGREEYETRGAMKQNWRRIYAPFIPENEYRRSPTPDDFCFIVFPDTDNPEHDEPQIAAKGEFEPLLPGEITMPETPEELVEEGDDEADSSDKDEDEPEDEAASEVENTKREETEFIETVASEMAARGVPEAQAAEQTRQVLTGVDLTQLTKERAVTMVALLFDTDLSDPAESVEEPPSTGENEVSAPPNPSEIENLSDARDETESETNSLPDTEEAPTSDQSDTSSGAESKASTSASEAGMLSPSSERRKRDASTEESVD